MKATARQIDILKFIAWQTSVKGYPPSVREIGAAAGIKSSNAVEGHLHGLEAKGLIKRTAMKARTITVTEAGKIALAAAANRETA